MAAEVKDHVRRVGGEQDLILFGQTVQNFPGFFLQFRVKERLRVLDQDHTGNPVVVLGVSLQKREHIDAAHTFSHMFHRGVCAALGVVGFCRNGAHFVDVAAHGVADLIKSAVSVETGIDTPCKVRQIHLTEFVFQKLCGLKGGQILRAFLVDQADALETAAAVLAALEQADIKAHSL